MTSKKINIKKEDSLKEVAELLMNDEGEDITLIIPNQSCLAQSEVNFKAIKKLAEATGKKVGVESVDEKVVQLAKTSGFEAVNPFFAANRPRSWEEIEAELLANKSEWLDEGVKEEVVIQPVAQRRVFVSKSRRDWGGLFRILVRRWLLGLVIIIFLGVGGWVAFGVLPRAEIKITTQKSNWSFDDAIAAKADSAVTPEIVSLKKNAQMVFPAAGKKVIQKKASGKIKVYNAYSSEPQSLVATTRFITGDGKVFRLTKSIVVPGAKIVDSKISPAYVEAEVAADQPGDQYNIGPTEKFTIPGFKGTPKYEGFYGSSDVAMKGGFSGEQAYPTDADIKNARARITAVLQEALDNQVLSQLPAGLEVPNEGAKKFEVLKFEAETDVNDKGEFAVFAEAALSVMGFEKEKVLAFLTDKMKNEVGQEYAFNEYDLQYGEVKADFVKKEMNIPVRFKSLVERPVEVEDLYKTITGKSERELKSIIFALPGLNNASVSLWPFYVGTIPSVREKVAITVD